MAKMTSEQVRKMDDHEIAKRLRAAASFQRENKGITWEHGADLISIVATHGDRLADALMLLPADHDDN